jgi:succinate-semialdehyde dehydrogenase/glutarate-semialdehyde dehydrogenase
MPMRRWTQPKPLSDWAAKKPRERSEILRKAWELMTARLDEFARLITLENGKARADAMGEATYAAEFFRWFAEEAVRADGLITHAPASGARIVVQHKPAGPRRAGDAVELSRRDGHPQDRAGAGRRLPGHHQARFRNAADHAGADAASGRGRRAEGAGQRAALEEDRRKLVDHMLHDPRVRVVSFTGSTGVGRKLLHSAADQVLKPAMELGGNAPLIVFEDADIDTAVEGAMLAKMRNLGEACTAANRFYVHEKVAEEFTSKFSAAMAALKMGNGLEDGIDVGPLVNADTRDKVAAFVEDALAKGAKLARRHIAQRQGFLLSADGAFQRAGNADCVNDEIFGPVAAIQTFTDEEDVIRRANDTEYGLVAYVFSENMKRAMQVCERLEYGMVGAQSRSRFRPRGTLRRRQAIRPWPRGRA